MGHDIYVNQFKTTSLSVKRWAFHLTTWKYKTLKQDECKLLLPTLYEFHSRCSHGSIAIINIQLAVILGSDRFLEPFLDCFVEKTFLCVLCLCGRKRVFLSFFRDPSSSIRTCSHKQVAHNQPQSPDHSFGGGSQEKLAVSPLKICYGYWFWDLIYKWDTSSNTCLLDIRLLID